MTPIPTIRCRNRFFGISAIPNQRSVLFSRRTPTSMPATNSRKTWGLISLIKPYQRSPSTAVRFVWSPVTRTCSSRLDWFQRGKRNPGPGDGSLTMSGSRITPSFLGVSVLPSFLVPTNMLSGFEDGQLFGEISLKNDPKSLVCHHWHVLWRGNNAIREPYKFHDWDKLFEWWRAQASAHRSG